MMALDRAEIGAVQGANGPNGVGIVGGQFGRSRTHCSILPHPDCVSLSNVRMLQEAAE